MRKPRLRIWWLMAAVAGAAVFLSLGEIVLILVLPAALILVPTVAAARGRREITASWVMTLHPLLYVGWLAVGRFLLNPWQLPPTGSEDRLFYSLGLPFGMSAFSCLYMPILVGIVWAMDDSSRSHKWTIWLLPLSWSIMMAFVSLDPFQLRDWFFD